MTERQRASVFSGALREYLGDRGFLPETLDNVEGDELMRSGMDRLLK